MRILISLSSDPEDTIDLKLLSNKLDAKVTALIRRTFHDHKIVQNRISQLGRMIAHYDSENRDTTKFERELEEMNEIVQNLHNKLKNAADRVDTAR